MKQICLLLVLVAYTCISSAQGPVTWKFSSKKIKDKTYEIHLIATVDEPWHIYSQSTPKGGPLPTKIVFTKNPLLTLSGKIKEDGEMEMYHDETFDVDVYAYGNKVDFVQVVKVKASKPGVKTNLSGSVEYMACTHEQCLSPTTYRFNVTLN